MSNLINNGIIPLNLDQSDSEKPTIIVMGVARSGTTMVAKVLHELGVYMGVKGKAVVMEDLDISTLIENKGNEDKLLQLIEHRNATYAIWGWKRPGAFKHMKKFIKNVRNPHLVFTFRDSLSISIRNQIAVDANLLENLQQTNREYAEIIDFIGKTNYPTLLVSYEKAILKRTYFVDSIAKFATISPTEEQKTNAINSIVLDSKDYVESARIKKYQGVVDKIAHEVLNGWVKKEGDDTGVMLAIIVNNKTVKNIIANEYRADLEKHHIGTGNHAYHVNISAYLVRNELNEVRVKVKDSSFELKNSPILVDLRKES